MNTCMKMILKVRLSRESILKFIAKASLAVLVVAGVFGTPTVHAFRNYSEYAAACRAEGGTPSPSPARCEMPAARSGSTPAPRHDYEAARRAQEAEAAAAAERQRQQAEAERIERERVAEEKRQKDAKFIRDRDATAGTLKGSSGDAMLQLKGMADTDSSGLKGSPFDNGGTGLKELSASDHIGQKAGSQSPATRSSLNGSAANDGNAGPKKEACPPPQDPSVVDLCFLGDRSGSIDPRILKGMSQAEKTVLKTSAKNMSKDLESFDKETYQAMSNLLIVEFTKNDRQWPGPHNPGVKYLNPLIEPEKVKAYWNKVNAGLHTHAEAQAKIMTVSPKGVDSRSAVARMDADPKFRKALEQIKQDQDKAEGLARYQTIARFSAILEKQGGAYWPNRYKNDKLFAARMATERDAVFKKMDQEMQIARIKALQQMTVFVKDWEAK